MKMLHLMKLLLIIFNTLLMLCVFAEDKCYDGYGRAVCRCQEQVDSLWNDNKFKLNQKEVDDFAKKCSTLNNFSEIVLEYEARLKGKYGDGTKVKIYMTAAAAMIPAAKDALKEYDAFQLYPCDFMRFFTSMHGCKFVRQGDVFIIDVKESETEQNKIPVPAEKEEIRIYVNKDELPGGIFVIAEDCITQSYSVIVIDGKQFKSVEAVLEYISQQPANRLTNGILFKFGSKAEYKLSKTLFDKVFELAKNKKVPFYSLHPRNSHVKDGKVFRKYIFQ